jgi:hypothetical protein
MRALHPSFRCFAAALLTAFCCTSALHALEENDLKDDAGKVIVHYFVEAPTNVAPAGTTDPAKQVGVIVCLQEHTETPAADLYPVRTSLKRLGLSDSYVLLAGRRTSSRSRSWSAGHRELIRSILAASTRLAKALVEVWPVSSQPCTPISSRPASPTVGAGRT